MTNFLNNYAVSLVAVVGLIVLTALNDVTAAVSVPAILTLVGVHVGANINSSVPGTIGTPKPNKTETGV